MQGFMGRDTMKKILCVDDEEAVLRCLKSVLEHSGYETITCSNPRDGLDLMNAETLDLVTLDIRMPEINGLEVYKTLKERQKDTIPVIFITAHATTFSMESDSLVKMWQKDFADGNTEILYKPFDISTLVEKVESLIGPAK